MTAEEFAVRLEGKRSGHGWAARCPGHEDRQASLSISEGSDRRVLVKCHAGCKTSDILRAMRLTEGDLFVAEKEFRGAPGREVATYDYRDERGVLLYQVVRYEPKTFRQRAADGSWKMQGVRRVPYRLPQLLAAAPDALVFVAEGEKDCDRLAGLGLVATTNPGGAGNWKVIADEARKALAGRHVVALPDNDQVGAQHARDVVNSLAAVAASVRVLELPGLPPKGDVSDWLGQGGTPEQLVELAKGAGTPKIEGFASAADRLTDEQARRMAIADRRLAFNVKFLDDATGGILPNDLIVLGARTGAGKTALASVIAQENARQGKHVYYFALEAEEDEIERRIKYRLVVDALYSIGAARQKEYFSYTNWYLGRLAEDERVVARAVEERIREDYRTLHTYYRGLEFTAEKLEQLVQDVHRRADLIVIDHLQYIDFEESNENRAYKGIVKRIRDLSLALGVPIILISHLRKKDRNTTSPVAELDDFHGTSDIVKIATKVILLGRAPRRPESPPYLWDTYMSIPKNRMDGSSTHYVAKMTFNARRSAYEPEYTLGQMVGDQFQLLGAKELPAWAEARQLRVAREMGQ